MKAIDLEQGSLEWLEYRKSKFNASETPALFGCGFISKQKLAKIKFENKEQYQTDKMREGQEAEDTIRKIAESILGKELKPLVCVWDEDERFSASLDGISKDGDTILECKFSHSETEYVWENNEPSKKYYLQVQHQLMVSGAKICMFIAMDETGDYEFCYVYPDKKVFKEIVKAWEKFINDYKNGQLEQEIPTNLEALCDELKSIMLNKKELETREKEIKEAIQVECLATYGDSINKAVGFGVTFSKIETNKTDYQGFLKANNLKISDDFITKSVSYRIGVEK